MRTLITGGGTGGHYYPALSVMKKLHNSAAENEIYYLGTGHGLEAKLVTDYDWIKFLSISIRGLSRQSLWRFLLGIVILPVGMIQGLMVVLKYRPDVIYGTGGYASFPVGFWGAIFRIPVVMHEINVKPGLTNRLLAPLIARIAISYPETEEYLPSEKCVLTGTPVRPELRSLGRKDPDGGQSFGLDPKFPIIMLFGGSKGSNVLVGKVLEDLSQSSSDVGEQIQFLLQTGEANYQDTLNRLNRLESIDRSKIKVIKYIDRMDRAYGLSDLVICRGGASTMGELIATEKPAVVVPWSGAAEDHQYYNARKLDEVGAAITVREEDWSDFPLIERLIDILEINSTYTGASNRLDVMAKNYSRLRTEEATNKLLNLFNDITDKEIYVNDKPKR